MVWSAGDGCGLIAHTDPELPSSAFDGDDWDVTHRENLRPTLPPPEVCACLHDLHGMGSSGSNVFNAVGMQDLGRATWAMGYRLCVPTATKNKDPAMTFAPGFNDVNPAHKRAMRDDQIIAENGGAFNRKIGENC